MSDLGKEFGKRFKYFTEIGKLLQFLKNLYENGST